MAKKKKGKNSGNPVLNALTEMLNQMSPEEKMMLMADLENFAQSGRAWVMCRRMFMLISALTIPSK